MKLIHTRILLTLMIGLMAVGSVFGGTWVDDFEDGVSIDWMEAGRPMRWTEADGMMTSELREDDGYAMLLTGEKEWVNDSVTCRLNVRNLAGGDWCGLVLRYSGEDSYCWFGISVAWTRYAAGVGNQRAAEKQLKVGFMEWYTLRVEIQDNQAQSSLVRCFVNGTPVFEFEENIPQSGQVGIFVQRSMTQFDDFKVSGAEILDGGPGFAVEPTDKLTTTWAALKR